MKNNILHLYFIGLYLFKLEIPKWLYTYVNKYKSKDMGIYVTIESILNSPDINDEALKNMILTLIGNL